MTHTKWVSHCRQVLLAEQESPTDSYVVALVDTIVLAQRINERFSCDDHTSIRHQSGVVTQMSINSFMKEAVELEARFVSAGAQQNCKYTTSSVTLDRAI
jgi:hypothetical protein